MRIASMVMENWMAFRGRHELSFPDGPIAVTGRYVGNDRRSNWSGKTALLEAITWAFFDVHRKRLDDGVIHHGAGACSVELTLRDGVTGVFVRRSRKLGGPTKLGVRIVDASGRAPDEEAEGDAAVGLLARVLRMNHEDFRTTLNFGQADAEAIVGMKSGARRQVVSTWLGLDGWGKAADEARAEATAAATDVTQATARVSALESTLLTDEERATLAEQRAEAKRQVTALEAELAALEGSRRIVDADARRTTQAITYERARDFALEKRRAVQQLPKPHDVDVEDLRRKRDAAVGLSGEAASAARSARANAGGAFDGTCPVTRSACGVADDVRANLRGTRDVLAAAERAEREATEGASKARAEVQAVERLEEERGRHVAAYNSAAQAARDAKARLDAMPAIDPEELDDARRNLARLRSATDELATARARVATIDARVVEDGRAAARIDAALEAVRKATSRSKVAAAAVRALGPTGIPARIAAERLVPLEDRANALLAETGLTFTLAWERETQDPASVCDACGFVFKGKRDKACPTCSAPRGKKRSDELDILVDDGSAEVEDVRMKSGGARVLVASAFRLTGGMTLRDLRQSPLSFAIVDEPFGFLDLENREMLARTFASMLGSVGLEQAFVVSHDAALLAAMPSRIVVVREDGFSRVEVES